MNLAPSTSSQPSETSALPQRGLPWASFATAAFAGCLSVGLVAISPSVALLGLADGELSEPALFGSVPLAGETGAQPMRILTGVSGETFAAGDAKTALAEGEAALGAPSPNVAPVAWDRLSAGGCMTVTTKTGQTFSFRILGARPAGTGSAAEDLPKLDLAVTACSESSDPVAKAVIEPTHAPVGKLFGVGRSL